ncbi:MAG TPA: YiiD C-terminal domain-containing protein [Ktedonobacterales bacterium]
MSGVEEARQVFGDRVPFAKTLGVEFEVIEPERAVVSMPYARERTNHVGTVHAAVEFGLGESAAGTLVFMAFQDLAEEGYVPVVANASIAYKRPAPGDLRAEATLSQAEQTRVRADIASAGKARLSLPVTITNADGVVACEMQTEWAIIKPRPPQG